MEVRVGRDGLSREWRMEDEGAGCFSILYVVCRCL